MDGPYLNSLIPIVGGVAASAWAPMSSVTTPTATNPRLYQASALVSSFMVLSLPSSHVQTLHHRRRSMRFRKGLRKRIAVLGVAQDERPCNAMQGRDQGEWPPLSAVANEALA